MRRTRLGFIFSLVCAAACGCATAKSTVGNKAITDAKVVGKVEKGKSTKGDVKTLLGEPTAVDFTDAGFEKWVYTYSEVTAKVSGFGGSSHVINTTNLTVQFDKDGIVTNIGSGQTTGGSGTGT